MKVPVGTTTISGHSAQSLNEVPGAWACNEEAAMPNAAPTPTTVRHLTTVETLIRRWSWTAGTISAPRMAVSPVGSRRSARSNHGELEGAAAPGLYRAKHT